MMDAYEIKEQYEQMERNRQEAETQLVGRVRKTLKENGCLLPGSVNIEVNWGDYDSNVPRGVIVHAENVPRSLLEIIDNPLDGRYMLGGEVMAAAREYMNEKPVYRLPKTMDLSQDNSRQREYRSENDCLN